MKAEPMTTLGAAAVGPAELDAMVGQSLGRPVIVEDWEATPIPVNAIGTEAVLHLQGTARPRSNDCDGRVPWHLLVKTIRSPRHWPLLVQIPEAFRETFIATYPWRTEADLRAAGLTDRLPDGLRVPEWYRCDDLGDDRIALWTEWIDVASVGWNDARYRWAAQLLGRMTARCRDLVVDAPAVPGGSTQLRRIVEGPVMQFVVPRITDPELRNHPLFNRVEVGSLFEDLTVLAGRLPTLIDHFESRPRSIGHGDACPQNLLIPRDDPDTLVAIDWSWPHPEAIGYDLSQLLIGHAHSGSLPVDALPRVHDLLIDGFVAGLRVEDCDVSVADVTFAFETALVVRSAYQSLPFERLDEPLTPELIEYTARRIALTRYLVDLGLAIDAGGTG